MIILCMFLFYCYKRHPSTEGYTALLTLLAIAIFFFLFLSFLLSIYLDYCCVVHWRINNERL